MVALEIDVSDVILASSFSFYNPPKLDRYWLLIWRVRPSRKYIIIMKFQITSDSLIQPIKRHFEVIILLRLTLRLSVAVCQSKINNYLCSVKRLL